MVSVKKAFDSGERPASQSERFCRTNPSLSDKNTARCYLAITRIRTGASLPEVFGILRCGCRCQVGLGCNITMVFRNKKAPLPDIGGLERTLGNRGRTTYYLAAELMRINASVCKERNIGAEESPVIRLTPDLQIYGNQEIYISVNPDICESRNEYTTT